MFRVLSRVFIYFFSFRKPLYSCRCAGKELSARLIVTEAPLRFNVKLWDRDFEPDKTCVLQCVLNKTFLNVEWTIDANVIKNDRKHSIRTENEVSFNHDIVNNILLSTLCT